MFGWDRPYYWTYGPGGNIYYQNDVVYYDNRQYLSAEDYYRQVRELAHSVPTIGDEEARTMEWSPLGVFAASHDSRPDDYRVMQLAVNRNGVLTGTYMNPQRNEPRPLQGMVDKTSRRAAWAFADEPESPVVFETSVYNLTLAESTMMVHFGPGPSDAQIWRLARLEQPDEPASQTDGSATRPALP